jgi:hypothetical protein
MITQDLPTQSSCLPHPPPVELVPSASTARKKPSIHWVGDGLLPEQFFGLRGSVSAVRPEVALMQAVLEDALICLQRYRRGLGRRSQRLAQEAEAWFLSEDIHWPFAFLSICEVLDLEPTAVRAALWRWRCDPVRKPSKKIRRAVTVPRAMRLSA